MVFALEPKIVLPGVGPVGIENSWVVTNEGVEKLTNCNEEIIELSSVSYTHLIRIVYSGKRLIMRIF